MRLQVLTEVEIADDFGSFQEAEGKVREGVVKAGEELMRELFSRYEAFICSVSLR